MVLLKGDDTLVAQPGGPVAVSPGGSPALATAGTGDVLSGLVGALLAKGLGPFEAAALGALAHGLAGRAAAERLGADHVMAGDVIDALPAGSTVVSASPLGSADRGETRSGTSWTPLRRR